MRYARSLLLGLLISFTLLFQATAADFPDPGTVKPGWELVWQDEFQGTDTDLERRWVSQNGPSGHILSSRWRENVTMENGLCRLLYKREKRGGQDFTSGNIWTRTQFKYGYFECRYRYGAAPGLNNSFWIMTQAPRGEDGLFEIDINEGHYADELNTNIHRWSGKHVAAHQSFRIGVEPAYQFVPARPVQTRKLRLVVREPGVARVAELRIFPPVASGYPAMYDAAGSLTLTTLPNLARDAKTTASSAINAVHPASMAVDGKLDTTWWTLNDKGPHTLTLDFGKPRKIGCIQLATGRRADGHWQDMLTDFVMQAWDGETWVEIQETSHRPTVNLAKEFHILGLEWNERELVWFFDGKEIRRSLNQWCHRAAPVWLSGAVIKWAGTVDGAEIDGTSMDVDYVRVYQKQGAVNTAAQADGGKQVFRARSAKRDDTDDLDLNAMIRPAPLTAKFTDPGYQVWCGSVVRGGDGKVHMFYSRWPETMPHSAWVTHSEVAHAVGDSPLGPFKFVDVALPLRGEKFWDGLCTHNPTVYRFGGKYYLYYTGNTGNGEVMKSLNWLHRNNQRIGVAVADTPTGPWKRFDKPLITVSADPAAADSLCMANPAVAAGPDGKYIFIYKAVGRKSPLPFGGPVVHMVATGDSPTGPVMKTDRIIFTKPGEHFAAEDSFAWYDGVSERFYAVAKDFKGIFTGTGQCSLALFTSLNGLDWMPARHPLASRLAIPWANGKTEEVKRLERPQLFFENGQPAALICAVMDMKDHPFNVQIPLRVKD